MADGKDALPEQLCFTFESLIDITRRLCERYGVGSAAQHPPLHEDQSRIAS